jgi:hypothetical protein
VKPVVLLVANKMAQTQIFSVSLFYFNVFGIFTDVNQT